MSVTPRSVRRTPPGGNGEGQGLKQRGILGMTLTVTTHGVMIGLCWITGLAFAVADVIYAPNWAALSTACLILGATLTVRKRVDTCAANWARAYELGRETQKGDADVRRIR